MGSHIGLVSDESGGWQWQNLCRELWARKLWETGIMTGWHQKPSRENYFPWNNLLKTTNGSSVQPLRPAISWLWDLNIRVIAGVIVLTRVGLWQGTDGYLFQLCPRSWKSRMRLGIPLRVWRQSCVGMRWKMFFWNKKKHPKSSSLQVTISKRKFLPEWIKIHWHFREIDYNQGNDLLLACWRLDSLKFYAKFFS